MNLGERVLIKPLHKIVRDIDGSIIPENGKNVILHPYHIRLSKDKDIEICEANVGKKAKPENPAKPAAGDEKKEQTENKEN